MIARTAGGRTVLFEGVEKTSEMISRRAGKRVDAVLGENAGFIAILPERFAALDEAEIEKRPTFARV